MWLYECFFKTCAMFFWILKKNHIFDSGNSDDDAQIFGQIELSRLSPVDMDN